MDGALGPRAARFLDGHLTGCGRCQTEAERHRRLRALVRTAVVGAPDPDWTAFWPGVQSRITRERPQPVRDQWWLPLWRPFWGHPRLSLGGALAAGLVVALSLWQTPVTSPTWSGSIVVQDVSTPDPEKSVMVYSTPEQDVAVIWLLNTEGASDES